MIRANNKSVDRKRQLKIRAEQLAERAQTLYLANDGKTERGRRALREAMASIRKFLLLEPNNYHGLLLAGRISAEFDDASSTARALQYFEKAIAICPDSPDAYQDKAGLLMYDLKRPGEAERFARKALSLAEQSGDELIDSSYAALIDILVGRRKYSHARWMIRRALRDCPTEFMKATVEMPLREIATKEGMRRNT
jgi:tetratricopeptide (TPR) repeat protein